MEIHKNTTRKRGGAKKELQQVEKKQSSKPITTTTKNPKLQWKKMMIFFNTTKTQNPPQEFLCPISGSLMSDPVIVSSGHSFDRTSIQACQNLNFTPQLSDGTTPNFTTLIPNLNLKSSIFKWTQAQAQTQTQFQTNPNLTTTENLVRKLISIKHQQNQNNVVLEKHDKEKTRPISISITSPRKTSYSSSNESIATATSSSSTTTPPLQSFSYSSPSSSEIEPSTTPEEEEIVTKLRNSQSFIIEEALISLRKITRTKVETRVQLCTNRILSFLRTLISSKDEIIKVNALASLVNLSLEKVNKVKIVRSGFVPPLIDVLKFGSSESREHACCVFFSLALDDDNKTAIGVLGALSPLLHALKCESERTRHDSALALYHLSLVRSNRVKMVKLGFVSVLFGMVKSGQIDPILLILGNLGFGSDGRAAMLDAGVVEYLVGLLGGTELESELTRESCVGVLYALSYGGLRFKAVAKEVRLVEVLQKMEKMKSESGNEKVRRILEMMEAKEVEEDEVDWEELLDSGFTRRVSSGLDESTANSTEL
ncbi:U-box domain-containing protein 40-like [Cicer arietinum]|uniref:RING-type E3 ubiquitin transferase n=1 Tax=Cicer arietinum TaxID=3827 RepID=A0A1S3DX98_CICAR|nr:U-box domain-containing protein 40-like isoform X1 [Cicer arietinum]XP_012568076.1 U-box domain-containing protein 40-like isoform X2 [Cicer arietinum]